MEAREAFLAEHIVLVRVADLLHQGGLVGVDRGEVERGEREREDDSYDWDRGRGLAETPEPTRWRRFGMRVGRSLDHGAGSGR